MKEYCFITDISRYPFYDIYIKELSLYCDMEGHSLELTTADSDDWGRPSSLVVLTSKKNPLPVRLKLRWNATSEDKTYEIDEQLDQAKAEKLWEKQLKAFPDDPFRQYVIGLGPYGGIAIWLCNRHRSVLAQWLQAEEIYTFGIEDFDSNNDESEDDLTTDEVKVFDKKILPPERLQSNMRQYRYRYIPLEEYFDGEKWSKYTNANDYYEIIVLDGVEVKRLDGTFDFTGQDGMVCYHEAGKPQRITVRWQVREDSYFAHFWLDETVITSVFDAFFNAFPDASADLLLRIDTVANRCEIAFVGEGQCARTLENTQYIVFKDFVEISRSDNYSKKDGEWRWM